jgi:hypothetical protein
VKGVLKTFVLRSREIRLRCAAWLVEHAPIDCIVIFRLAGKTRPQEERYHAMIGDIADQLTLHGRKWDPECMKRLLIDQFRRDTIKDPELAAAWAEHGHIELVPSIDGTGVVMMGIQSRNFSKVLASAFIEWLFAFGAEVEIQWSNETQRAAA